MNEFNPPPLPLFMPSNVEEEHKNNIVIDDKLISKRIVNLNLKLYKKDMELGKLKSKIKDLELQLKKFKWKKKEEEPQPKEEELHGFEFVPIVPIEKDKEFIFIDEFWAKKMF